ncbi:MAG: cytochrome c oxidase subunit 3 [Xanthomonadaceae bacterium]|nr:cytochrome c oxidase subunit 3 [Xanthomonadaceae bacterium]
MAAPNGGYYVPHTAPWPIVGSVGMFMLLGGLALNMQGLPGESMRLASFGGIVSLLGAATLIWMLFGWFGDVIRESEAGTYNAQVDRSFRQGMSWFIFSEVMFFAVFFGALLYARVFALPWLAGEGNNFFTNFILWPGFEAAWPTSGPDQVGGAFQAMGAWGLPALNTAILLTSGVTITIAHWGLMQGNRAKLVWGLVATIALGFLFVGLQAYEYVHAYQDLNLRLTSGIYGSTFFMLTGFHGMHVTLGAIMLCVILGRSMKGHFKPTGHFGFEAVAWYWHFVDVVWLALFVFVYLL